jgi:hypothetical protein
MKKSAKTSRKVRSTPAMRQRALELAIQADQHLRAFYEKERMSIQDRAVVYLKFLTTGEVE